MLMSLNCRWNLLMQTKTAFTLFLLGCRESALRASRAMVRGAAPGRGRPSDGVKLQTNREFQCLDAATTFSIYMVESIMSNISIFIRHV
jgi:hypothetical protein